MLFEDTKHKLSIMSDTRTANTMKFVICLQTFEWKPRLEQGLNWMNVSLDWLGKVSFIVLMEACYRVYW